MACCLELSESGSTTTFDNVHPETDLRGDHIAQSELAKERKMGVISSMFP